MSEVTKILGQIEKGDTAAAAELLPLVYTELRKLAGYRLDREMAAQTLQATALVHEAYIWAKSGGLRKAYVESVPVEITDGELKISFKQQVENPAIKAIEILPQSVSDKDAKPIRINAGASEAFTDSKKQVWSPDQGFVGGQVNPGTFGVAGFGPPANGGGPGGQGRRCGFGGFGGSRAGAAYIRDQGLLLCYDVTDKS
jgi:hypothetical protein